MFIVPAAAGLGRCDRASFLYLRNLPIQPPRGHEIVCQGWQEFHLDPADFANTQLFQVNFPPSV
ncbi:hypothetical protein [Halomicronema hongdechloris]|uniref:hypothetical protein n=1 Tax=Halomicronema hongdechloris TaxID=1209493 RepID=UPI0009BA19A3|nr:hypothetical protein [Halomicronema hongdechloris]